MRCICAKAPPFLKYFEHMFDHLCYFEKKKKPQNSDFTRLLRLFNTGDERIEKDINPLITQYFQAF